MLFRSPLPLPLPGSPLIEMLMRLLSLPSLAGGRAPGAGLLHLSGEGEERPGCQIQLERKQSQSSHSLGVGSRRQPRPLGALQSPGPRGSQATAQGQGQRPEGGEEKEGLKHEKVGIKHERVRRWQEKL